MKKYITFCLLVLLLTGCGTLRAQKAGAGSFIDGVSLYAQGEYGRAAQVFRLLSAARPEDDAVWYYRGMCEAQQGRMEDATRSFSKAVALDSANYWYRYFLARVYAAKGEEDMVTLLHEGLRRDFPRKQEISYALLSAYVRQQRFAEALELMDDIEATSGPDDQMAMTRYSLLQHMGRSDEALQGLRTHVTDYPSPEGLSVLGDVYRMEYQDSLARSCYDEALRMQGDCASALVGMAELYRMQLRYTDYFATLTRFLDLPDIPSASKAAYVERMAGSVDPKILALHRRDFDALVEEHLLPSYPGDSLVLRASAQYYIATARPDAATSCLQESARRWPDSPYQTMTYLYQLMQTAQWEPLKEASLQAFNRFHELAFIEMANVANYNLADYDALIGNLRYVITASDDAEVLCNAWTQLGDAYARTGDERSCYKAYKKALKINPDAPTALNNYAYQLSLARRQLKKALSMAQRAVELIPDNASFLDTQGWILHLQGREQEAKTVFKKAILAGGKTQPVILNHYADVLEALGETTLAQVYRRQAQTVDQ